MAKRSNPCPFDLEQTGDAHFEILSKANGQRYWYARDLMGALGYDAWSAFKKTLNKAIGVFMTLGISVTDHFDQCSREMDGKIVEDFKLSRLACCLTAMNGDTGKPNVAAAQIYFVAFAEMLDGFALPSDAVDRILTRQEISELEVTLSKTAAQAGVEFYNRFQNAGYRGMYNMNLSDLKVLKGIPDIGRSLLDFMKKEELAGNLFRLTLTEGRIKKDNLRGQKALESAAEEIGKRVRRDMIEETGIKPETLPIGPDIRNVRKAIRSDNKIFTKFDDVVLERAAEESAAAEVQRDLALTAGGIVPDCQECLMGSRFSHHGSPDCTSGSLASGGSKAHCECDYCSG